MGEEIAGKMGKKSERESQGGIADFVSNDRAGEAVQRFKHKRSILC